MPLPQKRWFRIAEVVKRWAMPLSDMEDYALDEMLQLAVFVVDIPAETGSWETGGGGGDTRLLEDLPILNGPQPLLRASLLEIFREGQAEVRAFRTTRPSNYLHVRAGAPAVIVRRDDLIVTREERDRFERDHAVATGTNEPATTDVWHSGDFTRVRVANEWHSFGPKQAAVLRLLNAASESDNPWLDGKRLLDDPSEYIEVIYKVSERKFTAWPETIRTAFAPARTVRTGKATFTLTLKPES